MKEAKKLARIRAKEAAIAAGEENLRAWDERAFNNLFEAEFWKNARVIFLYYGVGTEPDTRPIIERALAEGKTVSLPLTEKNGIMSAREVTSLEGLLPGTFSIPEPSYDMREVTPEETDLVIVPGASFDRQGGRLGKGGGYYDRFLLKTGAVKAAVFREALLMDKVPMESHDIPVDYLVTDEKVRGPFC